MSLGRSFLFLFGWNVMYRTALWYLSLHPYINTTLSLTQRSLFAVNDDEYRDSQLLKVLKVSDCWTLGLKQGSHTAFLEDSGNTMKREFKKMKNQQLWRRAVKCSTLSITQPLESASHSSRACLYLVSRVLGPSSGKLEPGRGSWVPTPPYLTVSYWCIMGQKQSLSLSSDVFPQVRASGSYGQFQIIVTRSWLNPMDKKTKDINVRREGI